MSVQEQSDQREVLDILSTMKCPGIMAGDIANLVTWATHGSDRRLDRALQALRKAGKARYVKRLGWQAVQ